MQIDEGILSRRRWMSLGAKGTVVELGRSVSDPRIYVEIQTDSCDGWVPAGALRRP